MKVFSEITHLEALKKPVAITIGNFDGVHKGHRALLEKLIELAAPSGTSAVITFINHPSALFRPQNPVQLITTPEHKVKLIEAENVDLLFFLQFNTEFANQTAKEFLQALKEALDFDHLLLGHDAHIGKNREGTPERLLELSSELNFNLHYLPAICEDQSPISSSQIRQLIREDRLAEAEALLGRPYSIYGQLKSFPNYHLSLSGLCLPPEGEYQVTLIHHAQKQFGRAQLTHSPLYSSLELFIPDFGKNIDQKYVEALFCNSQKSPIQDNERNTKIDDQTCHIN